MKTIVALYDSMTHARAAVTELESAGIPHRDISLVASDKAGSTSTTGTTAGRTAADGDHDTHADTGAGTGATLGTLVGGGAGLLAGLGALAIPGIGPIVAAGPLVAALTGAGVGAASGGLLGGLVGSGIPEKDAHVYAEGVRRGGALLTVKADEARVSTVEDILGRHDPVDIDEREQGYRTEGWSGFDSNAKPYAASTTSTTTATTTGATAAGLTGAAASLRDTDRTATTRTTTGTTHATTAATGEQRIPVAEESLTVGKRAVERGRVRVHSHVIETPVEESVRLRDETVHVERRAATGGEVPTDAFRDRTIEVSETDEEAVVQKQARVTGEVVVRKDVEERAETVRDTVRKTEVDIEGDPNARTTRTDTTRRDI